MGRVRTAAHQRRGHARAHDRDVSISLAGYVLVYAGFVSFGVYYIYKLLREGPTAEAMTIPRATGSRPMAFADTPESATGGSLRARG